MLELAGLQCGYGHVEAVHGIDLQVPQGQITALIGPNGAGKSSTMLAIAGQVQTFAGRIVFKGQEIQHLSSSERTRRGLALAPEGRRIFSDLTVRENLIVGGYLASRAVAAEREDRVMQLFARLRERADQRAGSLSGGEQQMLAIGRALLTNPQLLVLDEATEGLAPLIRDEIWRIVRLVRQAGIAVLVVDKSVAEITSVADRVVVLVKGSVVLAGPPEALLADKSLMHRMLGV